MDFILGYWLLNILIIIGVTLLSDFDTKEKIKFSSVGSLMFTGLLVSVYLMTGGKWCKAKFMSII